MTRMSVRHRPLMENLESRQVLSSGGPTAEAQYMLELVNAARANPSATIDRLTAKLDDQTVNTLNYYNTNLQTEKNAISAIAARSPLAWSDQLADAATAHSQDQASKGFQSHTGSDGSSSGDRIARTGYRASASTENAYAYSGSVDDAMRAFLIDWGVDSKGHRNNLLQTNPSDKNFDSIGFGVVKTSKPGFGPLVITQDIARSDSDKAQVLGVVYDDKNGNNFYTPGEGAGDVTIKAQNVVTGQISQVQTWDSGGYQIPLDPGTYQVSATDGTEFLGSKSIQVKASNVKVDFRVDQASDQPATDPTPVATIKPVQTQAAVPVAAPKLIKVSSPVAATKVADMATLTGQTAVRDAKPLVFNDYSQANVSSAAPKPSDLKFDASWITNWSNWKPSAKARV